MSMEEQTDIEDFTGPPPGSPRRKSAANGKAGWSGEIHPSADIFPMMDDEELQALADDIRENGLQVPIVLDREGALIDGRNRLRACELAKVEPTFQIFEGLDPTSFILSINVERRHLTKGQRAMAVAMLHPEPKRGRGKKDEGIKAAENAGFKERRLQQARSILKHSESLARKVLSQPDFGIDKALEIVKQVEGAETSHDGRIKKLRSTRPDLAQLVEDQTMTLDAAEAKAKQDAEELANERWSVTKNLCDATMMLSRPASQAQHIAEMFDPEVARQFKQEVTTEQLQRARDLLDALVHLFSKGRK